MDNDLGFSRQQIKILRYLYRKQRTVAQVYKRFHLQYDSFYKLTAPMEKCYVFIRQTPYENSLMHTTDIGASAVESSKRLGRGELRGWITTVIAVLAFALSIISLLWQGPLH